MEHKRPATVGAGGSGGGYANVGPARKRGPMTEEDMLIEEAMEDIDPEDIEGMMPPEEGEAGEVDLGEAGRNWMRPPVPEFDPASTALGRWHHGVVQHSMHSMPHQQHGQAHKTENACYSVHAMCMQQRHSSSCLPPSPRELQVSCLSLVTASELQPTELPCRWPEFPLVLTNQHQAQAHISDPLPHTS